MDPRQRTQSEEETVREKGGSLYRRATETPTETMEERTTVSQTPTGEVVKKVSMAGASPASAREFSRKKKLFRTYQILWYLLGFVEIVLAIRFILKMAGANPESGFADFMYSLSHPFVGPFLGLFSPTIGPGAETTAYIEWSTLVAMVIYVLLVWGIMKLLQFGKPTKPEEIERTIEEQ